MLDTRVDKQASSFSCLWMRIVVNPTAGRLLIHSRVQLVRFFLRCSLAKTANVSDNSNNSFLQIFFFYLSKQRSQKPWRSHDELAFLTDGWRLTLPAVLTRPLYLAEVSTHDTDVLYSCSLSMLKSERKTIASFFSSDLIVRPSSLSMVQSIFRYIFIYFAIILGISYGMGNIYQLTGSPITINQKL